MESSPTAESLPRLSQEELEGLTVKIVQQLSASYEPGRDRVITTENVYQPGVAEGRTELETFQSALLLPGSGVFGLENLDHCLEQLRAGRPVLFLADHLGNLDVPSFHTLMRREHPRYGEILERLIYIAGRKLNESSDFIKMFTEKYSRLVIVPRRDFPKQAEHETPLEAERRAEFTEYAARINRAAFRELVRLRRKGHVFVLFPLGGRRKPDADNIPVKESTSYLSSFDTAYLISMQGNTLPPKEQMEDERPVQQKVVFRISAPLDCKSFLTGQQARFTELEAAGSLPPGLDYEQMTVNRIMEMLDALRAA